VSVSDSNRVFIVHGHDNAAKEGTARFLEKLGLQPIILHEQPSGGRTIIEKFELFSRSASFAVVLLTPDDVGAVSSNSASLRPRARQNVVLELGYFMGRLGRDRVCALYSGGIELPSDYQGVIYVEMDTSGAWKAKLAQEFVQARLPINLEGLISG
jgi:predicted nucleotide-binding protein